MDVKRAIAVKQQKHAGELELRKEHVIAALLQAFSLAKDQANPAAMVSASREIGRLLGFYDPGVVQVPISGEGARLRAKYEAMSDEELCEIVAGRALS